MARHVAWHPYFLDVKLPKEGLTKRESYRKKGMSDSALERMEHSMQVLPASSAPRHMCVCDL